VANMYTVTYEYPVCEHNPILSWYSGTNARAPSINSALGSVQTRWLGTVPGTNVNTPFFLVSSLEFGHGAGTQDSGPKVVNRRLTGQNGEPTYTVSHIGNSSCEHNTILCRYQAFVPGHQVWTTP